MDHKHRALRVFMALLLLAILSTCAVDIAMAEPGVSKLVLNKSSATLGLKSYNNGFTLRPTTTIYSNKKTNKAYGFPAVKYVSSDASVAAVVSQEDGTSARVESVGAGTAVIKAYVGESLKAHCTVTVKQVVKASSLRLNKSSITRYATTLYDDPDNTKRAYQLTYSIQPTQADAKGDSSMIKFVSSTPSVCEVDEQGNMLAIKAGKARITAKLMDGSGKQSSCIVTVKSLPPQKVSIENGKTAKLQPSDTLQLETKVFPEHVRNDSLCFRSSKPSVAKVSKSGLVTAVAPGTAKIYVRAAIGSQQATITVTVDYKYRFYAIVNQDYRQNYLKLDAPINDLKAMQRIYSAARFDGGKVKNGGRRNLTGAEMRSYIKSIAGNKDIEADDVTIFYYSGHGADPEFGENYTGALCGVDIKVIDDGYNYRFVNEKSVVTVDELAAQLSKLPGHVIVIMDSCYSGALIKSKGGNVSLFRAGSQPASINSAIIKAFSSRSARTLRSAVTAKDLSPTEHAQFHVITASSQTQSSYEAAGRMTGLWSKDTWRSFFTFFVESATSGTGKGALLADVSGDSIVSLKELHAHVATQQSGLAKYKMTVDTQMWPVGDTFGVFAIN